MFASLYSGEGHNVHTPNELSDTLRRVFSSLSVKTSPIIINVEIAPDSSKKAQVSLSINIAMPVLTSLLFQEFSWLTRSKL